MQKLLLSGHAVETLRSLRAHGLSHGLLPLLDVILEQPLGHKFIDAALAGTDARVRADKGVSPGVPVRDAAVARGARDVERGQGARRAAAAGAVRRDGRGAARAGRAHRDPAPLRGDDQGDLVAAAALRAARRARVRRGCSSIRAFAPRTISSCCAARAARCRRRSSTGGRASRKHRDDAREAMLKPDEAPKKRRRSRAAASVAPTTAIRRAPAADE